MKLSNQQWELIKPVGISAAVIAISIAIAQLTPDEQKFPQQIVDAFPFADAVNNGQVWLRANYSWATRAFASVIRDFIDMVETFLILTAWPVIVLGIGLTAFRFGGLRLALICSGSAMDLGQYRHVGSSHGNSQPHVRIRSDRRNPGYIPRNTGISE